MTDTIKVQSARHDDRIALYEVHPDHPEGEVFIAGPKRNKLDNDGKAVLDKDGQPVRIDNVVEVAETPNVLEALKNGDLVKVGGKPQPQAKAA